MKKRDKFWILFLILLIFSINFIEANEWTNNLNNGLKAYWRLDEMSGPYVEDSVNGIWNGTSTNVGIGNILALYGKSYNMTSSTSSINFPNNMYSNITGKKMTLVMWVNRKEEFIGRDTFFVYNNAPFGDPQMALYIDSSGTGLNVILQGCGIAQWNSNIGDATLIPLNTWTMLTFQFTNDGSGQARVYINDTLIAIHASICVSSGTSTEFVIGDPSPTGDFPQYNSFPGLIDEIGWWEGYLSPEEIKQLYNSGYGLTYSKDNYNESQNQTKELIKEINELKNQQEEQEQRISVLESWKQTIIDTITTILNTLTGHETRITALENQPPATPNATFPNYFKYLSASDRKNMVCGYGEGNHLTQISDLGWNCNITYKVYRSGERATCKCKEI